MKKQILPLLLSIFAFILLSTEAYSARKISITSDKDTLSLDQEMIVTASSSGFTDGEKIYIKGAFYKEGSSNYFGLTKFDTSWIKNSASVKSQREIVIGSWDNSAVVKLDYEDSGFTGIGDYKFKLGFYYLTSSGNTSSVNWSENSLALKIDNEPTPTSSPEKVSNTSTAVTVSETEIKSSNTPTPRKSPTISATTKKNLESVKISNIQREASAYAKIEPISRTSKIKEEEVQVLGTKDTVFPKVYLASGGLLVIISAFILLKRELRGRKII